MNQANDRARRPIQAQTTTTTTTAAAAVERPTMTDLVK